MKMTEFARILETSSFLSLCRGLRQPGDSVFPGRKLRGLKGGEIRTLQKQGNIADNWANVSVIDDFSPLRIYGNFFLGPCILGRFAETTHHAGNADLPSGIFYSTLSNVIVADEALVHRCPLVSRYILDAESCVSASRLEGESSSTFGNGIMINAGIETGGRSVPVFYDLNPRFAEKAARGRAGGLDADELKDFLASYAAAARLPSGYAGKKSKIHGAGLVSASFIGPWVSVEGALRIRGCTLFAEDQARVYAGAGCVLDDTVVRPGCRFDTQAVISRSFFAEASGAQRQAKITESYIGPNSVIAEGEVSSSFVGPFTGFHHQSLLIAAFWPGGKGNVGHGANIGSNHSSRMPDGELWPGEGMFFGLGCNIKYPADYSRAPYTIIATGVTALPQKVEYPFSLITQQELALPEIPSGYNRLVPAWVLKDNFYALWRSREKNLRRGRTPLMRLTTDPLHEGNIALMKEALEMLSSAARKKDIYLPGDIPGTGKNILREEDRAAAAETYAWFIRFAYLRGLFAPKPEGAKAETPADGLAAEYLACLDRLYAMALSSRSKDNERGAKIIPDYAETHAEACGDEYILGMKKYIETEKNRL
ncbi:MAG: DUF4954 family protein [Spirochaetales bacterium]|jgi:hypothetical protein|nr:DUF4954 family protein [Spirochaetales bacterium]